MNFTSKRALAAIFAVCFAGSIFIAFLIQEKQEAAGFSMLQANLADFFVPTVEYEGERYTVENGTVRSASGDVVATSTAREVLLLAQYTTAHRLDPILALEGTDPEAFEKSVISLASSVNKIAQVYESREQNLIKNGLYPIDFLTHLPELEEARQMFLRYPSDNTAREYHVLLLEALQSHTDAIDVYQEGVAYAKEKAGDPAFHTLDGSVTFSSLENVLQRTRAFVAEQKAKEERRFACLNGKVSFCEDIDALFATFVNVREVSPVLGDTPSPLPLENMFPEAQRTDPHTGDRAPLVIRAGSACVPEAKSVQYMPVWREVGDATWAFTTLYADDLFLFDVSDPRLTDPFHRQVHSLGITYKQQQPFNFYICRSAFKEIASVRTTLAIRSVVAKLPVDMWQHEPQLAELHNEIRTVNPLPEALIGEYLTKIANILNEKGEMVFANQYGHDTLLQVEKALHLFKQQTSSAEELVYKILYDNSYVHARQQVNASPLGFTNLFVSRGIVPPFFSFNETFAPTDASPLDTTQQHSLEHFILKSYRASLSDTYTPIEIVEVVSENLRKYRAFVGVGE